LALECTLPSAACQHFSTLRASALACQHFSFFRFGLARPRTRNRCQRRSSAMLAAARWDDVLKC
jgi:hypothetical protein